MLIAFISYRDNNSFLVTKSVSMTNFSLVAINLIQILIGYKGAHNNMTFFTGSDKINWNFAGIPTGHLILIKNEI